MQAIVIAGDILEEKRGRARLTCVMTPLQERCMVFRIQEVDTHGRIPAISDNSEFGIERSPQLGDPIWKRVGEILVLTATEAVASHHNPTSEMSILRKSARYGLALVRRQNSWDYGEALRIEIVGNANPVYGQGPFVLGLM